jgi:hypothetical protein
MPLALHENRVPLLYWFSDYIDALDAGNGYPAVIFASKGWGNWWYFDVPDAAGRMQMFLLAIRAKDQNVPFQCLVEDYPGGVGEGAIHQAFSW